MFSKDQKQMAIAWTSWECEKKEERCSRIAVPRLASRSFRTRAWSPSTLSPRRGCTRHEDSSCNIKVRLTSRERTSIRFFLLFFFLFFSEIEIDGTRYEQTIAQRIFHPEITNRRTFFFLERKRVWHTIPFLRDISLICCDTFICLVIVITLHRDVTILLYLPFFSFLSLGQSELWNYIYAARNFHICNFR